MNGATEVEINGDIGVPVRPPLLTPEQAAVMLAICRTKVYELMGSGQLESVRIGSSRRIPMAAVAEFVQRLRSGTKIHTETGTEHRPFSVDPEGR